MSEIDWWMLGQMMAFAIGAWLAVWFLITGLGVILRRANLIATFKWDPRNPCRRWCRRCGQQQNEFLYTHSGQSRWEPVGLTKDKDCACQR